MSIELIKHIFFRIPVIIRLLLGVLLFMIFFGAVIHFIEPIEFPTVFEGVWWAFVTGATIGFGDYAPKTVTGQIVGILLILSGGGLLTLYITTISAATIEHEENLSNGKVAFKGHNHVIFIGWNERTKQLINHIKGENSLTDIILIDRTLTTLPYKNYPVHFIHGDASEDQTLMLANIQRAKCIIISANHTIKQRQSDHYAILTAIAIRGNNKEVPIIAEILTKEQLDNAIRAKVTTVIRPNAIMSALLYHEIFQHKQAKPFDTIFHLLTSQYFKHHTVPDDLLQKKFIEGVAYYIQEQNILLGVIRHDEWYMNPDNQLTFEDEDILITISRTPC